MSKPDGPVMGTEYAEVHVTGWIMNDRPVIERVEAIVNGTDGFAGYLESPVARVREFITHLLYTDDGSTYRAMYQATYRNLGGFESHVPALVREAFAREDFDDMAWPQIVADLMDEE